MTAGDIVGLVATALFAALVVLIGILLWKFGGVLDAVRDAIVDANTSLTPLVGEVTETVRETNKQLTRVDTITRDVSEVTGNVSALIALFAATVGGPLIKLAGFSAAVRAALGFGRAARRR
ncbi:DUF948 domain-containing protein [Glaciibacter flavus]|uniref:DUF948 domain-containing protein n=1 Tax=Orlajensenia flava TaxID=2565934 RepID=A0A4S4FWG8_9MICO|nr:DUF948 domain-containing protein [Glaciibacter flavus]THG35320.1 DUF948 domain-containing protein [Glaciibacter flavus]